MLRLPTLCHLLFLRIILGVLDVPDHGARSLALYFFRAFVPCACFSRIGQPLPERGDKAAFYHAVVTFCQELRQTLPDMEVLEVPPARVVGFCAIGVTSEERDRANSFPWASLVTHRLPETVNENE